jgi:hypothetical protein
MRAIAAVEGDANYFVARSSATQPTIHYRKGFVYFVRGVGNSKAYCIGPSHRAVMPMTTWLLPTQSVDSLARARCGRRANA